MRGRRRGPAVRCKCGGQFADAVTRPSTGHYADGSPYPCAEVVERKCCRCGARFMANGRKVK